MDEARPVEGSAATIPGWSKPTSFVGSWATKIVALAVAAGFLVSNLIGFLGDGADSGATPIPTGPRASVVGSLAPWDQMEVGDCIGIPAEQEFSEVLFVSCGSPHDAEVFLVADHPGADSEYPDEAAFDAFVDSVCVPAFADYTGSDYHAQTTLEMGWFTPTEETWQSGEHTFECYLMLSDGSPTSVSWRDSNP